MSSGGFGGNLKGSSLWVGSGDHELGGRSIGLVVQVDKNGAKIAGLASFEIERKEIAQVVEFNFASAKL